MGLEGIHVLEHPLKRRGGLTHRPRRHVKARTFPAQNFSQRARENFGAGTGAARLCGFTP